MRTLAITTIIALTLIAAISGLSPAAHSQTVPPGFVLENAFPTATFTVPVQIVFLPDGRRLVVEKSGKVWVMTSTGTQLSTPFVDLSLKVLNRNDYGLLGVAIDPDFNTNRWVYFLYAVDPDSNGVDTEASCFSRLERYQTSLANSNIIDLTTEQILVGGNWSTGIPSPSGYHGVGTIRFGRDKTLLFGSGDGNHFDTVDVGGLDQNAFGPGKTDTSQDIGAFRAQTLNSYGGKIMRVDKETGLGLPSNPYYDGNANSVRSRIWQYGLRNPYRFFLRPGTGSTNPSDGNPGALYIADVGWNTIEEMDVATTGGSNWGWPLWEGPDSTRYDTVRSTHYQDPNVLFNAPPSTENPAPAKFPPLWYTHNNGGPSVPSGWAGHAIIGGTFYTGSMYPPRYRGTILVADFPWGWIRSVRFDSTNTLVANSDTILVTNAGGAVSIEPDPSTGNIYYVAINQGKIYRITYPTGNLNPIANATVTPLYGAAPLRVTVHASGSFDPDGDTLQYLWRFGTGDSSTAPDTSHLYTANGTYTVSLHVTDGRGGSADTACTVVVGATPPPAHILAPVDSSRYPAGGIVPLNATAGDSTAGALSYQWDIDMGDSDALSPSTYVVSGRTASFVAGFPHDGEFHYFRIRLSVSQGSFITHDTVFVFELTPPVITGQPSNWIAFPGEMGKFSVADTGYGMSYQWQRNAVNISGATGPAYLTPATTIADSGASFRCIVGNLAGNDTSNGATLIVIQTSSDLIQNPGFESGTTGWRFYTNGTGSFTTFSPAYAGTQSALISITTTANNVQLYPANITLTAGTNYRFSFAAKCNTGHSVMVSLQKNVSPFTSYGFVSQVFHFTNAWATYSIDFTATGFTGTATDGRVTFWFPPYIANGDQYSFDQFVLMKLVAIAPVRPSITAEPVNQSVIAGASATFGITATGTQPLYFQWQKNGVSISGATGSTYTTPATTSADSGAMFRCYVTNAGGSDTSASAMLAVITSTDASGILSDNFDSPVLNTSLWTFFNPLNDVTLTMNGSSLSVSIPGGPEHDAWTGGVTAPRIMQSANNTNFQVEAKFLSLPATPYQAQGVLVQQDSANFLRFDFVRTAAGTKVFAASIIANVATVRTNIYTTLGNPVYLRVNRIGNTWTSFYSLNDTTWTAASNFSQALTVHSIGPFFVNAGSPAPPYTGRIDYFFNSAAPIIPTRSYGGEAEQATTPRQFGLEQNFPNPFNPTTTIRYTLPVDASVDLRVYDLLGREVRTLVGETQAAGYRSVVWDSRTNGGTEVSSGVYIYRLTATPVTDPQQTYSQVMKMIYLK